LEWLNSVFEFFISSVNKPFFLVTMTTSAFSGILGQQANLGFRGDVPPGLWAERNAEIAKKMQDTLSPIETFEWFYNTVRNNAPDEQGIRRMELWKSMDYLIRQ